MDDFMPRGENEGVFAKFYDRYEKTGNFLDNGLPEFKQRTYIEIRIRNSYEVADRPAEMDDMRRFPREYQIYQIKSERMKQGTPLNQFAFLTPAQIDTCDFRGVYTVEDLAGLDKDKAQSIGLVEECELAKKFLEVSKDNQAIFKLQEEIARLKNEIERLKEEK